MPRLVRALSKGGDSPINISAPAEITNSIAASAVHEKYCMGRSGTAVEWLQSAQ